MTSAPRRPRGLVTRIAIAIAVLPALAVHGASAAPPSKTASRKATPVPAIPARPTVALTSLPVIARVHLGVGDDHVVVVEDVVVPRGDWRSGELGLFVAFGSPGAPLAFDARLFALDEDGALPPPDAVGEPLAFERAPRKPGRIQLLLGKAQMSGVVVRVGESAFRRATAPSELAMLRVRTLLQRPDEDASSGREIVVRLGDGPSVPMSLGRIEVASESPGTTIARAEARLCGPDADPSELAVTVTSGPRAQPAPPAARSIVPAWATRRSTDDLCVRFWTTSKPEGRRD